MESQKKTDLHLDSILVELGALGRYQLLQYFYLAIIVFLSSLGYFSYIFTAAQLDYRCKIPSCDRSTDGTSFDFAPEWLHFAVPFNGNGQPESCHRFQYDHWSPDVDADNMICNEFSFNQSVIESCDDFVFAPAGELTIVNEFNITCEDNDWQLALIGSLGFMADLAVQPICAYFSDKYGRRPILIATLLFGGVCGLIKSCSISYAMFATMEFLTAFVTGGSYMTIFIMAIEAAAPRKRVFSGTLISFMFSTSQACCGLLAMLLPNFRSLLQVVYGLQLCVLAFIWMVPESVRWLLVNGNADAAKSIIVAAAKTNKIQLSSGLIESLDAASNQVDVIASNPEGSNHPETFVNILRSRILAIRLAANVCVWFLIKLVYFGMTIQSVTLDGNKYVNYIVVCAVELPAILLSSLLMEWVGRKWSLFGSLLLTGVACVATEFIPQDAWLASLLVYLIGKCSVTIAFSIVYVYSTEQFPTSLRHSTMNVCYSIGTIGSILAPFTMVLVSTWPSLPLLIFAASGLFAGLLVLMLPETRNTRLPDTIVEAEKLSTLKALFM